MKGLLKGSLGVLCLVLCATGVTAQKQFVLKSPDGHVEARVDIGERISYEILDSGETMLSPSVVSMNLSDGRRLGVAPKLAGSFMRSADQYLKAVNYKRTAVRDHYNELTLRFNGDYSLTFRAYDDGVAYRFSVTSKGSFTVQSEQAEFNFPSDVKAWVPYVNRYGKPFEEQFCNSFENTYAHINLSHWDSTRLAFLPLLAEGPGCRKVCITEADLMDYPGMYLHSTGATTLKGVFAPYPAKVVQGGHNDLQMLVHSREQYIARCNGPLQFPWRVVVVTRNDMQLADNDMIWRLATTADSGDYSWVRPGKVAWDWWNDWNLYGVGFRAGINNDTYKYYIDFAARNGIEYVILDEGWAVNKKADLMQVVPEIDLPQLVQYAARYGVGLILWAGYWAMDRDMENVCRHYSQMGIKGFKVDFMDRDDQPMVGFHRRMAAMGAKYKLMIDLHGTYKPTGLQRTYPNVVNFEGVHGLEQLKWADADVDQVVYDVTIPFIRQVAGPIDYTQGAMRNAIRANYRSVNSEPMSQGTRCRQLAQYVVFESPLNMLCDSPSNYEHEPECLSFIAAVPTVWDETRALAGEVGKYVAVARRSGETWYVGAMTDWDAREMELDLSFLAAGDFSAEMLCDGVNADRVARDYRREHINVPADRKLKITMAPGGGFAARITSN